MAEEYCWVISQTERQSWCSEWHSSMLEFDFNCIFIQSWPHVYWVPTCAWT